jgi:ABC-2 type transport system ATP-binding protein
VADDFSLGQPSLDEVFLVLTDRPAEPAGDEMEAA